MEPNRTARGRADGGPAPAAPGSALNAHGRELRQPSQCAARRAPCPPPASRGGSGFTPKAAKLQPMPLPFEHSDFCPRGPLLNPDTERCKPRASGKAESKGTVSASARGRGEQGGRELRGWGTKGWLRSWRRLPETPPSPQVGEDPVRLSFCTKMNLISAIRTQPLPPVPLQNCPQSHCASACYSRVWKPLSWSWFSTAKTRRNHVRNSAPRRPRPRRAGAPCGRLLQGLEGGGVAGASS